MLFPAQAGEAYASLSEENLSVAWPELECSAYLGRVITGKMEKELGNLKPVPTLALIETADKIFQMQKILHSELCIQTLP